MIDVLNKIFKIIILFGFGRNKINCDTKIQNYFWKIGRKQIFVKKLNF